MRFYAETYEKFNNTRVEIKNIHYNSKKTLIKNDPNNRRTNKKDVH